MIKKLKKIFTGEFIDELFNFSNTDNNSLGGTTSETTERVSKSKPRPLVLNTKKQAEENKRRSERGHI